MRVVPAPAGAGVWQTLSALSLDEGTSGAAAGFRPSMARFVKESRIEAPAALVFGWHERPEALVRLVPPWTPVRIVEPPPSLGDGARAILSLGFGPARVRWVAEHRGYQNLGPDGGVFEDVQVRGPFARWVHRHTVRAAGPRASTLTDEIEYELPLGRLGLGLAGWKVRRDLERMFEYRHRVTREACEREALGAAG